MQQALAEALRRRDAGENFDLPDVPKMDKVIAPATHTAAYNPAPPTQMTDAPPSHERRPARLGLAVHRRGDGADVESPTR